MSGVAYLINEEQVLLLAMKADTDAAQRARDEMIAIITAWKRGRLLPHRRPRSCASCTAWHYEAA